MGMPFNLQDPFTLGLDPISKYYVDYCEFTANFDL